LLLLSSKSNTGIDLSEFKASTKENWIQMVPESIDYQSLIWILEEGVKVEPFYTNHEPEQPSVQSGISDVIKAKVKPWWENRQIIRVKSEVEANSFARQAVAGGANGLILNLAGKFQVNLEALLKGISLSEFSLVFQNYQHPDQLWKVIQSYLESADCKFSQVRISLADDLIAPPDTQPLFSEGQLKRLASLIRETESYPHLKMVSIPGNVFHDSGASHTQEIAYSLSLAVSFIDEMEKLGIEPKLSLSKMEFQVGLSCSLFPEIAKCRALIYLVSQISKAYKMSDSEIPVHGFSSSRNKSVLDTPTNILRNTVETMAGVLGNCDSICLTPHDFLSSPANSFSARVSRNVSNVLSSESYFGLVKDPGAGSYYLESLTESIARQSWQLFQEIELKGGFIKAYQEGFITGAINQSKQSIQADFDQEKKILVGVNKYMAGKSDPVSIQVPDLSNGEFGPYIVGLELEKKRNQENAT